MKVLYATYRYDPTNPDEGSSIDFEFYKICRQSGYDVKLIGPVTTTTTFIERVEQKIWRVYKKISRQSGLKFPISTAWRASRMLRKAIRQERPDIILSFFPPFFVFYNGSPSPYIWIFDTTFLGQEEFFPLYGALPLKISVWQEQRALRNAAKVITKSEWSKQVLIERYHVPAHKIEVMAVLAALPKEIIPSAFTGKKLSSPLNLLLVGRVYERKGIDIAIETARQLNEQGTPTQLIICGMDTPAGEHPSFIRFVGNYSKKDPQQLSAYAGWYEWAHLLIHPARFEAAGIVPSEAAAFGTPTLTNDVGGLATTVKDGESGIVLPRNSPPEAYVQAIRELIANPEKYNALCKSARLRYERELNSEAAGKRLAEILNAAVK